MKFLRLVCANIISRESEPQGAIVVLKELVAFCDFISDPIKMIQFHRGIRQHASEFRAFLDVQKHTDNQAELGALKAAVQHCHNSTITNPSMALLNRHKALKISLLQKAEDAFQSGKSTMSAFQHLDVLTRDLQTLPTLLASAQYELNVKPLDDTSKWMSEVEAEILEWFKKVKKHEIKTINSQYESYLVALVPIVSDRFNQFCCGVLDNVNLQMSHPELMVTMNHGGSMVCSSSVGLKFFDILCCDSMC